MWGMMAMYHPWRPAGPPFTIQGSITVGFIFLFSLSTEDTFFFSPWRHFSHPASVCASILVGQKRPGVVHFYFWHGRKIERKKWLLTIKWPFFLSFLTQILSINAELFPHTAFFTLTFYLLKYCMYKIISQKLMLHTKLAQEWESRLHLLL